MNHTTSLEIWKNIEGYDGLYQISNLGRVKRSDRKIQRIRDGKPYIALWKGRILKVCHSTLYPSVVLCKKNKKKRHDIHRLLGIAFIPNPNNKPELNHKDGDKENFTISNLEWVTNSENKIHAYENGLAVSLKGEKSPNAKLTRKDVEEIRRIKKPYIPFVAHYYGVSHQCIRDVLTRRRWKHV